MQADAIDASPGIRASTSNPLTVLIAEDDAGVRELVAAILTRCGYAVLKARHSAEALHLNGDFKGAIHLLLTDLCMEPHLNGRQLADLIRHARPGIPVLYISGYVEDNDVFQEVESGLAHFLPKPFTRDGLTNSVRQALGEPVESD